MSKFENHLLKIAKKIDIKPYDRYNFQKDFDIVRNYVFNILCKLDKNFATIFSGYTLFGSFANDIRIHCPNEFDVIMELKFPFYEQIKDLEDYERPGYVHLDFTNIISTIQFERYIEHCLKVDDDFMDFVSEDLTDNKMQYLERPSLQSWLNGLFRNAFKVFGKNVFGHQGNQYNLSYRYRGIAYTVTAKSANNTFSIDFVPGVMYCSDDNEWFAVPKTKSGPKETKAYTFLMCDPCAEANLLNNIPQDENLKIVLRLLQSLRNRKHLPKLRCYFLVTVCLWEIKNQHYTFWCNSVSGILLHMIYKLCNYFEKGFLPFYWDDGLNLLSSFSVSELEHYKTVLNCCYSTLNTYDYQPNLTFGRTASHFDVEIFIQL